jgi:cytochrome c peroxidase
LEHQSLQPLENQDEMGHSIPAILSALQQHPEYPQLFAAAFSSPPDSAVVPSPSANDNALSSASDSVTADNLALALASFQRTLRLGNTEVDRFRAAEYAALSTAARQGLWIFESRGKCWQCHSGDNFTDEDFHNTGVSFGVFDRDLGRYEITRVHADRYKFKTPTLRGAALTAPYMHDGSIGSLEEVVEFYNRGGSPADPELDKKLTPLNLSETDKQHLVEFLKALSR